MADTFKTIIFAFILFALTGAGFLYVIMQQAPMYDKDTSGVLGGSLDFNKFNQSISDIEENAQGYKKAFEEQNIFMATLGLALNGFSDILKSIGLIIIAPFDLLNGILLMIGIPSWIIDVILGMIIIALILGIWYLYNIGD